MSRKRREIELYRTRYASSPCERYGDTTHREAHSRGHHGIMIPMGRRAHKRLRHELEREEALKDGGGK